MFRPLTGRMSRDFEVFETVALWNHLRVSLCVVDAVFSTVFFKRSCKFAAGGTPCGPRGCKSSPSVFFAPCRLWGIMCPWFICWFWHYIYVWLFTSFASLLILFSSLFSLLWPPCVADVASYFCLVISIYFFFYLFYSSPNLSHQRVDVYHTSTHGVALVRI